MQKSVDKGNKGTKRFLKNFKWQLWILLLPGLIFFAIFCYAPLYGAIIAFKEYNAYSGIVGSPWATPFYKYFQKFVEDPYFFTMLRNTLVISLISLLFFPVPIIFALFVNEIRSKIFKRTVQTISYAPYFISVVVGVGMLFSFLKYADGEVGIINRIIIAFGGNPKALMESSSAFPWIYALSGLWQGMGWWAVMYIATLSNVDPNLLDAAKIDGAGRLRQILYIKLPVLLPTISITLILNIGNILNVGFEKVLLMQNSLNYPMSNIISTYVYEKTIGGTVKQYSYGTAIGLFNNVISLILVLLANFTSKKIGGETLL